MAFKLHERDLRGKTEMGWLDSRHTFSFGSFQDPARSGFRDLLVINEDFVIPGGGFQEHGHDNMEIISYVVDGALAHKDSMGTGSVIKAGDVQKMGAGSGVRHSEFNHSDDHSVHFLQIWIQPSKQDTPPNYEQISMGDLDTTDGFVLVGDRKGRGGITIQQDAQLYMARPQADQALDYQFESGRYGFIQLIKGQIEIEGHVLNAGDGLEISDVSALHIKVREESELMLFDLA